MNRVKLIISTLAALCVACLALFALNAGATASTNEIEGIWSFGDGAVAIQQLSNGTFQGTVVKPIKFATCEHPVGEVMWTGMREQPDGSFWGDHQWYHGNCEPDPDLGPTAWRVLATSSGEQRYLKVCLSKPGTSQPTIAPDGTSADTTYGCIDSNPLGELPETTGESPGGSGEGPEGSGEGSKSPGESTGLDGASPAISFTSTVELPSSKVCVKRGTLKIRVRNPTYDPLEELIVSIDGKRIAHVRGIRKLRKQLLLQKLPAGTFELNVLATTVLKQHLSGHRTYRACTTGSGKIELHHPHKLKLRRAHGARSH